MSKKIRLTALALAVLMVVPMIFAGCSKDGRTPADTTPAVTTASDNPPTSDNLPTTGNTAPATETTPAPATEAPPEPAPEPPVQSLTIAGTALDAFSVCIRLCSIECCFRHALTDETCPENRLFKKDIEDWNEICSQLYIWDYTTDYGYYLMPFPNFDSMRDNARFFADYHVKGLFEEGNYNSVSGEFGELRGYLLAKLLWDPYMDESAYRRHMREFCEGYYGPGGDHVMEILDLLQETTADRHIGCGAKPIEALSEFALHVDRIDALWDAVEAKAQTDLERSHIERSRLSTDYIALMARWQNWFNNGEIDTLMKQNEAFYEKLLRHGIERLQERTQLVKPAIFSMRVDRW